MIDLDEVAASDISTYDGLQPTLSTVTARARRRRRNRHIGAAGAAGLVLVLGGVAGAMLTNGPDQQVIDTAQVSNTTTSTTDTGQTEQSTAEETRHEPQVVTAPEGLWLDELLPQVAAQLPDITESQLQAALTANEIEPAYRPDGVDSWEGLLFPAVYEIGGNDTAIDIIRAMSDEFTTVADELGYQSAETRVGVTPYEAIVVASIVEAESGTDQDRPKIARVIYNRLEAGLSVDIDSICIYGVGDRDVVLTQDLLTGNDESTDPGYACRNNPNLPPTPIATPSRASLRAAIDPTSKPVDDDGDEIEWLYYAPQDAEGNRFFTDDYDLFIEQLQRAREQGLL